MSAASHADSHAPYKFALSSALSTDEQQTMMDLLALLPNTCINEVQASTVQIAANNEKSENTDALIVIKNLVDGRGLACPMPLLKTKVALREVAEGEALYIVATDPNSQADISAFCRQSQSSATDPLSILVNTVTNHPPTADSATHDEAQQSTDTIFHFIITKSDSN